VAEGSGIWVPPGGSADPRREEPAPQPPSADEITPEQLLEEMRKVKVSDLVLSMLPTLAQLSYAKLDPASRDLEQVRLGIETLRALLPVLEGHAPEDFLRDYRQVVSNLQLAYVNASAAPAGEPPSG
jgi:hypothetical protein